jgi:hypothetical protein
MKKLNLHNKSFILISHVGSFLPLLIILNLLFGWLFFSFIHWLLIELGLIILFILNSIIFTKKIFSTLSQDSDVVDIEGRVVEDRDRLK